MKNMFSNLDEVKVPKSFKECYRKDCLTENLWTWSKSLETVGIILACIMGGLTFITGLLLIGTTDGGSLILSLIGAPIIALLQYASFHVWALSIGSKASIVQYTKISANISMYKTSLESNEICEENSTNIVSTKTSSTTNQLSRSPVRAKYEGKGSWHCQKCGNLISSDPCVYCGNRLS